MTRWHSLYLLSNHRATIDTLIKQLVDATDYDVYNPFSGLPGQSYPHTFKVFIAPSNGQWTRVLLDDQNAPHMVDRLIDTVALECDTLAVQLDGDIGSLHGYRNGILIDIVQWCEPHLKSSQTDIEGMINREQYDLPKIASKTIGDVPLSALPDDMQQMARQVNATSANSMFKQLSQRLRKTIGFQNADQILHKQPNWDSQSGQMIRAIMAALTIPDGWRTPDFTTLRSAYTIYSRHEQGLSTFSREDEALVTGIPSLDAYLPVYAGKMIKNDF